MSSDPDSTRRIRVLLVDGNLALGTAVQDVLQQHGLDVAVASSEAQARAYLVANDPVDVVVLDARVGDADGHDILMTIREDTRWKLVRVIMLTSFDSTHDVRRSRRAGADDYLFKPVRPDRLVEHVVRMATSP